MMSELGWLFSRLSEPRSLIDILVVTSIIYWLLWVAQGTRASQVLRGVAIFLIAAVVLAGAFNLTTLSWLLDRSWPAILVALPVVFQAEIRRALEQLGHTGSWLRTSLPATTDQSQLETTIDELVRAAAQLSRLRYGALMVIERETGLQDYVTRGVLMDAAVSRQLLVTIFFPNSPLHDAAVILRGDRIVAGSVVLPLTDNISAMSQLGTRHRAGIGVTEDSDALSVIVSEESGHVSVAHHGRLIRNLDQDRLRRVLRSLTRIDRPDRAASTGVTGLPGMERRLAETLRALRGRLSPRSGGTTTSS